MKTVFYPEDCQTMVQVCHFVVSLGYFYLSIGEMGFTAVPEEVGEERGRNRSNNLREYPSTENGNILFIYNPKTGWQLSPDRLINWSTIPVCFIIFSCVCSLKLSNFFRWENSTSKKSTYINMYVLNYEPSDPCNVLFSVIKFFISISSLCKLPDYYHGIIFSIYELLII